MDRGIIEQSFTWISYHVLSYNGTPSLSWTDTISNLSFIADEVILKAVVSNTSSIDALQYILTSNIAQPQGILCAYYGWTSPAAFDIHFPLKRPIGNLSFRVYSLNQNSALIDPPSYSQAGNNAAIFVTLEFVKYKTK